MMNANFDHNKTHEITPSAINNARDKMILLRTQQMEDLYISV